MSKRVRVDILIPQRLHQALVNHCEEQESTKTDVILIALKKHLWLI